MEKVTIRGAVLTGTPEAFQELMEEVPATKVILLKPGESTL